MSSTKLLSAVIAALVFSLLIFVSCEWDDDEDDDEDCPSCQGQSGDDDDDSGDSFIVPPVYNEKPPWAEWALHHWVWENESTQESAQALPCG